MSQPAPHQVQVEVGGRPLTLETGKLAKQANGAVLLKYGDTQLLVTACMDPHPSDRDFLPLTVDYREYTYSAGKIPGGFFKREGRPSEREILISRFIDRPLRPLFPATVTLYYGTIAEDGAVIFRAAYDHRALDGATMARALARLEQLLNGVVANELQ